MGYIIEKEGYEYRGVKLGQKCIYFGDESTVIGFDENDDGSFIAIRMDNYDGIHESECATIVLKGHEKYGYDWMCLDDIELLPYEEILSQQISPIHVADVLEDVLKMDMTDPDEAFDIRCIITECIKSLRT